MNVLVIRKDFTKKLYENVGRIISRWGTIELEDDNYDVTETLDDNDVHELKIIP